MPASELQPTHFPVVSLPPHSLVPCILQHAVLALPDGLYFLKHDFLLWHIELPTGLPKWKPFLNWLSQVFGSHYNCQQDKCTTNSSNSKQFIFHAVASCFSISQLTLKPFHFSSKFISFSSDLIGIFIHTQIIITWLEDDHVDYLQQAKSEMQYLLSNLERSQKDLPVICKLETIVKRVWMTHLGWYSCVPIEI